MCSLMRAALVVTRPGRSLEKNLIDILNYIQQASRMNADLVLFAEAAYTGLINTDDIENDLSLFIPIPGDVSLQISSAARQNRIYVGLGLLERENEKLYDSAILIDTTGKTILKYRRNSIGWHSPQADPSVYCQGNTIPSVETTLGKMAFIICGDLFEDKILEQLKCLELDYLLFPLARSFDSTQNFTQERWDEEIKDGYLPRFKSLQVPTLMVNYYSPDLSDGNWVTIGGAVAISSTGEIKAGYPIAKVGLFLIDI